MAGTDSTVQRYSSLPTVLDAVAEVSSLILEISGAAPLFRGMTSLEQARAYEARVEIQVALEECSIIASKAMGARYEELTKHLERLEAMVLSLQKAYLESRDHAARERNRELLQLAVDALERATLIDR
ncbi:MAG TPA: hypothetical protein PKO27_13565 [Deltaproteobacteria bacterium]|jgi:hypothetical protein|nr:hypothetical protein [Deltaproteobacteria bacterium]